VRVVAHAGSESPSHEASKVEPPTTKVRRTWAGLRTHEHVGGYRRLLAVASQSPEDQCMKTAVVLDYRCGAVPDLHWVPY
jgi:hypothetical protein